MHLKDTRLTRHALLFGPCLLALLALVPHLRAAGENPPVVIGAVLELTGKAALSGQQVRRGVDLALEEINAAGGIRGRRLEVVTEDSASNNSGAVNALNKLAGRGDLAALLAPIRSTQIFAMLPRLNEIGLPAITGGTNENITRQGSRWIFRDRTDDGLAARLAARFAVTSLGARRIGILHDTDAFGTGGMQAFTAALHQLYGIAPVDVEKYHAGDRDYTGQLLNLRNAGADLVVSYSTLETDIALILRRYRQLGLPYRWLGSPSAGSSITLGLARREAEGIYVFTDFSPELPRPRTQAYRAEFRRRYGEDPDIVSTYAYDGIWLLADALGRGGGPKPAQSAGRQATSRLAPFAATPPASAPALVWPAESLRRALLDSHLEGAAGRYAFDAEGNGRHDIAIVAIERGRHRVIEVVDQSWSAGPALRDRRSKTRPALSPRWITAAQLAAEGLALGAVYALVALGFVLLYNAASLVNFAQGELVMLAGFLLATFGPRWGRWMGPLAVLLAMAAASVVFRRLTYDPIARAAARDFRPFIVTTLGASLFLKNLARLVWGAQPALADSPFGRGSTEVAGVFVPYHEAGIVAVTVLTLALLYLLFQKTMLGIRLRAVAQDRDTAALMGIPVPQMMAVTFAGALLLAGLGGVLLAPVYFVYPEVGSAVSLKAFSASIVGGFGSVPGAIAGGLLLGVAEMFGGAYISQAFRDAIAFVLLILVLVFRPSGLFGEKAGERT